MYRPLIALIALTGCLDTSEESPGEDTAADVSECCEASDTLDGDVADLSDAIAALQNELTALRGSMDQLATREEVAQLQDEVAALAEQLAQAERDAILLLSEDTTWTVGPTGDHPDLPAAMAALQRYVIADSAAVTLQLEPGTHRYSAPIALAHASGARIRIVGDPEAPGTVQLEFEESDGLTVRGGYVLGYLDGVSIVGDAGGYAGIHVEDNGVLLAGGAIEVSGFGQPDDDMDLDYHAPERESYGAGVRVAYGGVFREIGEEGSLHTESNDFGVLAVNGGIIEVPALTTASNGVGAGAYNNAVLIAEASVATANLNYSTHTNAAVMINNDSEASGAGHRVENNSFLDVYQSRVSDVTDGSCYRAYRSSAIHANNSSASNCQTNSYYASSNSHISAADSIASGNGESGYRAYYSASIGADDSESKNNVRYGYYASHSGVMLLRDTSASGNGSGNYSPSRTGSVQIDSFSFND